MGAASDSVESTTITGATATVAAVAVAMVTTSSSSSRVDDLSASSSVSLVKTWSRLSVGSTSEGVFEDIGVTSGVVVKLEPTVRTDGLDEGLNVGGRANSLDDESGCASPWWEESPDSAREAAAAIALIWGLSTLTSSMRSDVSSRARPSRWVLIKGMVRRVFKGERASASDEETGAAKEALALKRASAATKTEVRGERAERGRGRG